MHKGEEAANELWQVMRSGHRATIQRARLLSLSASAANSIEAPLFPGPPVVAFPNSEQESLHVSPSLSVPSDAL